MDKAAGRRGFGWEWAPVVPSCHVHVVPDRGAAQGQKASKKKGKRWKKVGSNTGYGLEQSMSVYVFYDTAHCCLISSPVLTLTQTA